jgi:hypothetical protein
MGGHFDGIVAGNRRQSQRRASGFASGGRPSRSNSKCRNAIGRGFYEVVIRNQKEACYFID